MAKQRCLVRVDLHTRGILRTFFWFRYSFITGLLWQMYSVGLVCSIALVCAIALVSWYVDIVCVTPCPLPNTASSHHCVVQTQYKHSLHRTSPVGQLLGGCMGHPTLFLAKWPRRTGMPLCTFSFFLALWHRCTFPLRNVGYIL